MFDASHHDHYATLMYQCTLFFKVKVGMTLPRVLGQLDININKNLTIQASLFFIYSFIYILHMMAVREYAYLNGFVGMDGYEALYRII